MMSTVGLELTSFMDPDLTWKTVSKRNRSVMRRARRPLDNSLILGMEPADKNARTVEDVTVSESEKVGVDVLGRHFSEKVESVPIKKRRFIFQSPLPPPPLTPYLHLEASEQHVDFKPASDQNIGSSTTQRQQLMNSDYSTTMLYDASINDEKIPEVINGLEDFSGIEILAAAACSDSICNGVTECEGNPLVEETTQEKIQSSASSTHLEETTASLEAACCFPKDSVNKSDKDKKSENTLPLPDDKLLWDLNVSMDVWPGDGGTVDTQKGTFINISARSEELQTTKPQDIKNYTLNEVDPSDVDGGNKMTSDLRTLLVGTDGLSSEKQEFEGCSSYDSHLQTKEPQDIRDDTTNKVVSSDADEDIRMSSAERTMPVATDDSSIEKQESEGCFGYDSHLQTNEPQDTKYDTTEEMVSSDADGGNRMNSAERTMPVGTDDLSIEKQEFEGCSGYDSHFQTKKPQDAKHDTKKVVVSSDVDGSNRLTSNFRIMLVGIDDLSTEKQESEGCFDYDSQLQANEPQDTKHDTTKEVVSSDVDGVNRLTSDLRTMLVGIDDLSTQKQEFEGCSGQDSHLQPKEPQDIKNDTTKEVVSYDVDGGNRLTSDSRIMPVEIDDLSTKKQGSEGCYGYNSHLQTKEPLVIENDSTIAVVSSGVEGGNRLTSGLRSIPVGTDDLSTEKPESEGCYGYNSHLLTKEPQVIENETTIAVVSSGVEGGNRLTSGLRSIPVGTDDLSTEKPESEGCSGYDSQFEDGELRESDVQCWEEAEQVDYDTEFEEERSFGLEAESGEQELKVERGPILELTANFKCCRTGEALRKNSVSLKIRTLKVSDGETMKIDCLDGSNNNLRVDLSRVSRRELLSCVEGSLSSDVAQKSRCYPRHSFNGSYPRARRGAGSDKFAGSDRSYSHVRGRSPGGAHVFNSSANYWDSKRRHPPIYDFPDIFRHPRPEIVFGNREYPTGHRITRQFMGSYRSPVRRRSPIERVDSYNMHLRIPTVRDTSPDQNRFRRYPQGVSRGIGDEYLRHIPDDSTQCMSRMLYSLDRRERSISPHSGRPHHVVPYKRVRSRSRSRSPIDWLLQRDRNEDSRCRNRSPDFRSDAKMDRVRLPSTKRFGAGYGESVSPPRRRVSPQRNFKMFEDHNPGSDHFRGRKLHVKMQDQRFDQARPILRLNSNDYFNPMIRPRRFPDSSAGDKGCKYEVSDAGKHGSRYATIHRDRFYDADGGSRRFRYNEEDPYMVKTSLSVTNATGVSSLRPDDVDAPKTASEDR